MDEKARRSITKARATLILRKPFFGYLATYLEPTEMPGCPTIGTDGKHLYYNPKYINSLAMDELTAVIAHEVFHCAFGHVWRCGYRDVEKWNIAADGVTNVVLTDEGFHLPSGGVMDGRFKGLSVEEAYRMIKDKTKEQLSSGDESGKGSESGGAEGKTLDDHSEWGKKDTQDAEGRAGLKGQKLEDKWREQASRARQLVKTQGAGMGSLDDLVDELIEPRLNWREILRNLVMSSVISDYQILPPNKRHVWRNIYLPSSKRSSEIEVAFIVDVSGSMSLDEVKEALSELKGICDQFDSFKIFYVECDWDIQKLLELTPYSFNMDEVKKIRGRGGTRFPVSHIFEEITKEGGNPSSIVYFTDGYGNIDGDEPPCPVIWLLCAKSNFKPKFGRVIDYERER
jgi:predicted metal-dependent peptidase